MLVPAGALSLTQARPAGRVSVPPRPWRSRVGICELEGVGDSVPSAGVEFDTVLRIETLAPVVG